MASAGGSDGKSVGALAAAAGSAIAAGTGGGVCSGTVVSKATGCGVPCTASVTLGSAATAVVPPSGDDADTGFAGDGGAERARAGCATSNATGEQSALGVTADDAAADDAEGCAADPVDSSTSSKCFRNTAAIAVQVKLATARVTQGSACASASASSASVSGMCTSQAGPCPRRARFSWGSSTRISSSSSFSPTASPCPGLRLRTRLSRLSLAVLQEVSTTSSEA